MKTMTCTQLGGACHQEFTAQTFEEIIELSKAHGLEMFHAKDAAHLEAITQMMALMQTPAAMQSWLAAKQKEFESL